MSRVSIHLDESVGASPKAVLVVCGIRVMLSQYDLESLLEEAAWARNCLSLHQQKYFASLANKYKRNNHV